MKTDEATKHLFVIGGPNGAGKTTSAYTLMPELIHCDEYVNADSIAASLSPFKPESTAMQAGRLMLSRIHELSKLKVNFAFETTMASRSFVNLLKKCKDSGYRINLLYFWVKTPELAKQRVQMRVKSGGHSIPLDVIERRYHRSMSNFINLYLPYADRWLVVDNSETQPFLVAQKYLQSTEIEIYNQDIWQQFRG